MRKMARHVGNFFHDTVSEFRDPKAASDTRGVLEGQDLEPMVGQDGCCRSVLQYGTALRPVRPLQSIVSKERICMIRC